MSFDFILHSKALSLSSFVTHTHDSTFVVISMCHALLYAHACVGAHARACVYMCICNLTCEFGLHREAGVA